MLRNLAADAAERLGLNAQVRGEMLDGCMQGYLGVLLQELFVALGGGKLLHTEQAAITLLNVALVNAIAESRPSGDFLKEPAILGMTDPQQLAMAKAL